MDVSLTRSGLKRSSRIENYSGCCLPLNMTESKILALKYRPQEFKDLLGQEVMVKTILNAIKFDRVPNAYLLTGMRGVGKTTTARLIAKALNCLKNNSQIKDCDPKKPCSSCSEINDSRHIDVLEMDAASKTGIDDVRELIESSKYSPTNAKFKIFIIDEVHMLSKQAFNGLLKTLEEPPPSLKFIMATTEVRKIPITILSRCQRFDLKRIDKEILLKHLKNISLKEGGNISESALKILVSASEGSMRDGISLLDKALILQSVNEKKQIDDEMIRQMLGLANKTKIIELFKEILTGKKEKALSILDEMLEDGLDANYFLNDFLDIIHLFSTNLSLGKINKNILISDAEKELINNYAKNLDMNDVGLFWQLTIKTIEDMKVLSNESIALQMFVMQLIHLKGINNEDSKDFENQLDNKNFEIKKKVEFQNEDQLKNKSKEQLKSTNQIKAEPLQDPSKAKGQNFFEINSFDEIINLAKKEKEVELKFDLERNVRLVSFKHGKIEISFNEKLNKNFIKLLTEKLFNWTGNRWVISFTQKSGQMTSHEKKIDNKNKKISETFKTNLNKDFLSEFPDAKIFDVLEDGNE